MKLRQRIAAAVSKSAAAMGGLSAQVSVPTGQSFGSGYEGARQQRRLLGFRPTEAAINSLIISGGPMLRSRARDLVRNNPYAKKAQRVFVSALVGTGIRPIPQIDDPELKQAVSDLWHDWTEEADADGLVDLYGLQVLAARAMFDAGECFIRLRARRPEDGLSVPFQLQLLESEFCPYQLNSVVANGNQIRAGVEFDAIGKRVAYWFWKNHPGEYINTSTSGGYTRVPAEEVIHLFEPVRPGQIRGVSWLSAAIVRAYVLDAYDDAEVERKKTAALFAGFIKKVRGDDDGPLAPQDQPEVGATDPSRNADNEGVAGLTPGMLQVLLEGEDITFSQPADVGPNYEAFEYRALLGLCAAMDLPYASVTGDRNKANYSSDRAGMIDMRAAIAPLQRTVMIFQMCRPVFRRFMTDAVLAGALKVSAAAFNRAPRDYVRAQWVPPKADWIDPKKDAEAEMIAIRAGFKSREQVVLSQGATLAEVDAAIARSNQSADDHGLVLDSDPRRTNLRGSAPPPDAGQPADDISPDAQPTEEPEEEAVA